MDLEIMTQQVPQVTDVGQGDQVKRGGNGETSFIELLQLSEWAKKRVT